MWPLVTLDRLCLHECVGVRVSVGMLVCMSE